MTDRAVHPIEAESYAILRSRVDLTGHPPLTRAVMERVIHATADLTYAEDLVCDEPALHQGWTALHNGAPIVTDVAMVASGITTRPSRPTASGEPYGPDTQDSELPPAARQAYAAADRLLPTPGIGRDPAMVRSAGRGGVVCRISDPAAVALARECGITRSAAAMRLAAAEVGPGAVWVIGCAPTALYEVIAADVRPALVIGLPVGFVGAAESKAALRASGLPSVSNRGEKGGSAVAAAAVNALLYRQVEETTGRDV